MKSGREVLIAAAQELDKFEHLVKARQGLDPAVKQFKPSDRDALQAAIAGLRAQIEQLEVGTGGPFTISALKTILNRLEGLVP